MSFGHGLLGTCKDKYMKSTEPIFLKNKDEIINKYISGYGAKELEHIFNIPRQTITKLLKKHGIITREKGDLTSRQQLRFKNTIFIKYGVDNISQVDYVKKIVSQKTSKRKKENNSWCGENNPNYENKIGKNNGYHFGRREDIGDTFFRSSWEANIARIFNHYQIEWIYEPKRFKLSSQKTYTPDFYLPKYNIYVEVKGWWRDDAKIKYNLFLEEHRQVKIKLIDSKFYYWIINRNRNSIYLEGIK